MCRSGILAPRRDQRLGRRQHVRAAGVRCRRRASSTDGDHASVELEWILCRSQCGVGLERTNGQPYRQFGEYDPASNCRRCPARDRFRSGRLPGWRPAWVQLAEWRPRVGVEADIQASGIGGRGSIVLPASGGFTSTRSTAAGELDWFGTLRRQCLHYSLWRRVRRLSCRLVERNKNRLDDRCRRRTRVAGQLVAENRISISISAAAPCG